MTSPSPARDPRGRPGKGDRRDLLSLPSEVDYVLPTDPEAPSRTRSHGNQRGVLLSNDGRAGRPGSSGPAGSVLMSSSSDQIASVSPA